MINKVYPLTTEKSWKSALIDADRLLLLSTSCKEADKFLSAYDAAGIKGWLRRKKEIALPGVTRLLHPEVKAKDLLIMRGRKTDLLSFVYTEDLEELAAIVSKAAKLQPQIRQMSKLKAGAGWLIALIFTAFITWLLHGYATGDTSGIITGRYRGLTQLLYKLGQLMGPQLVLLTGTGLGAFIIYKTVQKIKNPPNEVVYE
jgi:hypothetical protein